MKSQQGIATLMITSLLLVVALLFSLASYKNLFYQIKRSQNEVLTKQAYWQAEGGLECATSFIFNKESWIGECDDLFGLNIFITSLTLIDNRIFSHVFYGGKNISHVSKEIIHPFGMSGLFQSTSDLVLEGSIVAYPDPNKLKNNSLSEYECLFACFLMILQLMVI